MDQERKHPPTPNRLAQARREGECFFSAQLAIILYSVGALVGLWVCGAGFAQVVASWTTEFWSSPLSSTEQPADLAADLWELIGLIGVPLIGGLFAIWCGVWLAYLWQTGWVWGRRPIVSLAALSPAARLAQWFSTRRLASSGLGVVQAVAMVSALIGVAWWRGDVLLGFWAGEPEIWDAQSVRLFQAWLGPVLGVMLCVAVLDYVCQRALYHRGLRMTDDQLRDEMRQERRK